jgi:hypothetical protein
MIQLLVHNQRFTDNSFITDTDTLKLAQLLLVCVQTAAHIVRIPLMAMAVVMPLQFAVPQLFGLTVEDFVILRKISFCL